MSDENERVGGADGDEGDEGMGRFSLSSHHSLSSGDLEGGEMPVYSGYLYKKSTGMIKSWQKRWFELEGSTVRWMKNKVCMAAVGRGGGGGGGRGGGRGRGGGGGRRLERTGANPNPNANTNSNPNSNHSRLLGECHYTVC